MPESTHSIRQGYDIPLAGRPSTGLSDSLGGQRVGVFPQEFSRIRPRLLVEEGAAVKRGTVLLEDKRHSAFKLRAPAAGRVERVERGARRFVERIVIECDETNAAESFRSYTREALLSSPRDLIVETLVTTGYLALIRQRPFSRMADHAVTPKAIFVNGMNSAPFRADAGVVVTNDPEAFAAGLTAMTRLTDGKVVLCVGPDAAWATPVEGVERHTFQGPHPAGNSSVHISRVSPMGPTDVVWTVTAVDLVLIGRLLLDGELPTTRIVALGGPGVKAEACAHYRVRMGGDLETLLNNRLHGDGRVISGDALSGHEVDPHTELRFLDASLTVIPVGGERRFLGWTAPGFDQFSVHRSFGSWWWPRKTPWSLTTGMHGGVRAWILSGYYDRVMPLNIMTDYLLRAIVAGDTEEAIRLGILETDPEDFALCEFICPSKTEIQAVIRQGLAQIEEEGI